MLRHAYLILAYNQWDLLRLLIHLLDDNRNDIYIHIDKKIEGVPFDELKCCANYSKVFISDRIHIDRGTYSIFKAQLILLKDALKNGEYSYFHLLSGQDLPVKSQNYIHKFFVENDGKNFIDVVPPDLMKKEWYERYSLFQPLSNYYLGKNGKVKGVAKIVRKVFIHAQKVAGVNRFKKYENQGFKLCYGSSWFSITNSFASYLIKNEELIERMYGKMTYISEESIPQTFLQSSEYKDTLYDTEWIDHKLNRGNLRLIFWSGKTSPDTITMNHFEEIQSTHNLFARKFDIINHPDVVEAVVKMILI